MTLQNFAMVNVTGYSKLSHDQQLLYEHMNDNYPILPVDQYYLPDTDSRYPYLQTYEQSIPELDVSPDDWQHNANLTSNQICSDVSSMHYFTIYPSPIPTMILSPRLDHPILQTPSPLPYGCQYPQEMLLQYTQPTSYSALSVPSGTASIAGDSDCSSSLSTSSITSATNSTVLMQTPTSQSKCRTSVTRTRTGCWPCRARHKKCDGRKPFCRTCVRLKISCMYGECPANMRSSEDRRRVARELTISIKAASKKRSGVGGGNKSEDSSSDGNVDLTLSRFRQCSDQDETKNREEHDSDQDLYLPDFLSINIDRRDIENHQIFVRMLEQYETDIPQNIYIANMPYSQQLFFVLVYMQYVIPATLGSSKEGEHMVGRPATMPTSAYYGAGRQEKELIDVASRDALVWRSACALGSIYVEQTTSKQIAEVDGEFRSTGPALFKSIAKHLMAAESRISARTRRTMPAGSKAKDKMKSLQIRTAMIIGWNIYILASVNDSSIVGGEVDLDTLRELLNLVSHFSLIMAGEEYGSLVSAVTKRVVEADILVSTWKMDKPLLVASYGDIVGKLDRVRERGGEIHHRGIEEPLSIVMVLSLVVEVEDEMWRVLSTGQDGLSDWNEITERLQLVNRYLDRWNVGVDRRSCQDPDCDGDCDEEGQSDTLSAKLFKNAVRIYMEVFCVPEEMAMTRRRGQVSVRRRKNDIVKGCVQESLDLLSELLIDSDNIWDGISGPEITGEENEDLLEWAIVMLANVIEPCSSVSVQDAADGRRVVAEVLRNLGQSRYGLIWDRRRSAFRDGRWAQAQKLVEELWKEENWTIGLGWQELVWTWKGRSVKYE
ncbi:uncharacterized protein V1516DRAFT_686180 [Lipomyces oligophaga]|uniref:uncharacterized protein n=1 Tax=Lipomyces oligophaga TaxID=45792 RepID=UPI0034CFCA6A